MITANFEQSNYALNSIKERLVMLRSSRITQFSLSVLSKGEVTSSGDGAPWCQAPGLRGQNLTDIKSASISKTAELHNVNCHLTPPPKPAVPAGSCCRSGVERELNQGFSCYKSPSTSAGEGGGLTETKGREMGLGTLFSWELKTECCSSSDWLGGKRGSEVRDKQEAFFFFF